MDARRWLSTVFQPALERESLAYTNDADLLRGQLAALHDCELLDDTAHSEALRQLETAVETARERARFHIRHPTSVDLTPPPTATLSRVLAVAQPLAVVDGMPFVLTSAELWSDGVYLFLAGQPTVESEQHIRHHEAELNRWGRERREGGSGEGDLSAPQLRTSRLFDLAIELRDDVGTGYHGMGGGGGGGRRTAWRLHRRYEPGVPDNATRLIVEVPQDDGSPVGVAIAL
jgi:hypothetical protein